MHGFEDEVGRCVCECGVWDSGDSFQDHWRVLELQECLGLLGFFGCGIFAVVRRRFAPILT